MSMQDKALQLATDFDLTGNTPNLTPYTVGSFYDLQTAQNVFDVTTQNVPDIGQGAGLWMEFEVTEAFLGYVSPTQIPQLRLGIYASQIPEFTVGSGDFGHVLAWHGYPLNSLRTELGLQSSDSLGFPSLFLGDRYYLQIPANVFSNVWRGVAGTRSGGIPTYPYIAPMFCHINRVGQPAPLHNVTTWPLTNFTAGKMSVRIVDRQYLTDGAHHYVAGMKVK